MSISGQPKFLLKEEGSFCFEHLIEHQNLSYERFKEKLLSVSRQCDLGWKKRMLDQLVYLSDSIEIMIPVIKNDQVIYELKEFTQKGGFTNCQLFYQLANNLKEISGDFNDEWLHKLDGLVKQDNGTYKVNYSINI
jgi:hypothetical protein